ncbi:hypothetical protein OPQ81_000431 [Rhizoctonia solani]|nr:hypothetical protein OPQ81_000431 [Rhizoctonia solani]
MSSIEPFRDQKVIVIGGSSGVGRSIATAALAQGASVVIASSSPDKVTAAIKLLREGSKNASGISVKGQAFDIKDSAALTAFLSQEAPFDHLVITAGAMPGNMQFPQDQITDKFKEEFERVFPLIVVRFINTHHGLFI